MRKGLVAVMLNTGETRIMSAQEAAAQRARSKGGRNAHAKGTRYKFTSETARQAALKLWSTRWRKLHYSGARAGRPSKQRPSVNRAALREYYSRNPTLGITCGHGSRSWVQDNQPISERSALVRLGHLRPARPTKGFVPIDDGMPIAFTKTR